MRRFEDTPGFPDPSSLPGGDALLARWEQLLTRSPRLRPWLAQMISRQRLLLTEGGQGGADVERGIWHEHDRWLRDFEALPQFAVSAIATELQEEKPRAAFDREPLQDQPALAAAESPEQSLARREALLADPAFALAFHCIDARVRPSLDLSLPEAAWFGLLHATVKVRPQLDAEVAVALVLRMLSPSWSLLPAPQRRAALRLFLAAPADLRATSELQRLCAALPEEWRLTAAEAPAFLAAASRARAGLSAASSLCARIVVAIARSPKAQGPALGGLKHLLPQSSAGPAATADELARVRTSARQHLRMPGFRRLESLL